MSGKFVDLALRFSPPPFAPGGRVVVWVEVKHGSGVHGSQLTDYLSDIEHEAADRRLVLVLAPRQSLPDVSDVPETMPVVAWQTVAAVVRDRARSPAVTDVERFLLNDYLAYLAEEGLMDEELLTAEHAFALRAEPAASAAVAKLVELTDGFVAGSWGARGDRKGGRNPAYGPGYWAHYALSPKDEPGPSARWRSTTFEWGLIVDTCRDDPRNAWAFVAGATFYAAKDNPAALPDNAAWLGARRGDGFEYVSEWCWRLFRFRYPEELLAATTLDGQVEALGSWILESFALLANAPPPH